MRTVDGHIYISYLLFCYQETIHVMLISIMVSFLLYLQGLANIKFDDFMENKSLAVSLVS